MQDKVDRPVLIVSDTAEEVMNVRELLQRDCSDLFTADNDESGLRLFQERKPSVLVLAFQELERSERFYLTLYRRCSAMQEIAHQTLLLCKNNESEAAFSLCRNGTFDDYLVNRPLHDPFRLRLAVHQSLVRQLGKYQSASVSRQLAHIGSDLRHLDSFVGKALEGGQAQHAESIKAFREFAARLAKELDQFELHMGKAASGEGAKIIEETGLRQQFTQMRREHVEPSSRQVESKLQDAQQWVQKFDEGYREQVDMVTSHKFPVALPEVMLVDDDEMYREMLGVMLEEVEFRVSLADCGEAALADMRKRRPSVVLLDYNMPGLGGIATLKEIRKDPELRSIPVVILSSNNSREVMLDASRAGAAGLIIKPSNRPTIVAKIRSLLAKPK
jgi:CheY-like chemotaxis protein